MKNRKKNKRNGLNIIILVEVLLITVLLVVAAVVLRKQVVGDEEETQTQTQVVAEEIDFDAIESTMPTPHPLELSALYTEDDLKASDIGTENEVQGTTIDDGVLDVVIMGDSIWDNHRGEGISTAEWVEKQLNERIAETTDVDMEVRIHNLAVGGTCAAVIEGSTYAESWSSRSLTGMMYSILGRINPEPLYSGEDAYQYIDGVDLSKVDYFVFSYGLNDYFFGNPVVPEQDLFDLSSYVGSLRHATFVLRQECPDARFLIMAPTYCQFYEHGEVTATCLDRDYGGGGTLDNYVGGARLVSEEYNTLFLDAFNDFGFDASTMDEYYEDGVHLNGAGMEIYASHVSNCIWDDYCLIHDVVDSVG